LHAPKTMEEIELGRARILLNDLLYFAIHNELNKKEISAGSQFNIKSRHLVNKIIQSLPYRLTPDQNAAVVDMMENAEAGRRIHALVCGDVGTGKTVICTLAAAGFIGSGYQAVIMAPTQVLAKQHYDSISKMLEPFGVKTVFLDSSLKKSERTAVLKEIREGSAQLIIGTNSCIGKDVIYKDLALTVVDEEHRFGVNQRAAIIEKAARGVHSITMSATPIPRSLAQVVYGDNVQLYTIRTRPEGRLPVKTRIFKNELGNMKFVLKEVRAWHQAYVVCPMIEQSDKSPELKSVDAVSQMYRETLEPYGVRIAELTGKTPKEEADGIIDRFKSGEIDVLIATTVIEVGVNVPNATVMIITNAERFGLSSLHQLRGRVGRSSLQSYCVLQSEDESEKGLSRLQVMCDTNDGFQIAEADLKQRGAGDLLGTQQSGDNKYVSLIIANPEIYREAVGYAKELINRGWDCCPLMEKIREERQGDLNAK
ncbi:MAG: DEAD/DEAH box helicase, partial [Spirochaetales bacterium]|nr:DEAD/DEAH box helicase [Spirochaetales bacterium]